MYLFVVNVLGQNCCVCHIVFLPTFVQQQLNVNHIFHKCSLTEPQAKGVLKALQLVKPHYTPKVPEASDEVKYPALMKSWYLERGNVHPELNSVPGHLVNELDETKLKKLFEEQISKELSGFTPILSIESEKDISGENKKSKALFLECRDKWREALIESIEKELIEIKNSKGTVLLLLFILVISLLLQVRAWQNQEPLLWSYCFLGIAGSVGVLCYFDRTVLLVLFFSLCTIKERAYIAININYSGKQMKGLVQYCFVEDT